MQWQGARKLGLRRVGGRTLLQTALFSLTSSRTSEVFITRFANFRISLTASGACFLNCEEGGQSQLWEQAPGPGGGGGVCWSVHVNKRGMGRGVGWRARGSGDERARRAQCSWSMHQIAHVRVVKLFVQVDGVLPRDRVPRAALLVLGHGGTHASRLACSERNFHLDGGSRGSAHHRPFQASFAPGKHLSPFRPFSVPHPV